MFTHSSIDCNEQKTPTTAAIFMGYVSRILLLAPHGIGRRSTEVRRSFRGTASESCESLMSKLCSSCSRSRSQSSIARAAASSVGLGTVLSLIRDDISP